LAYRKKFSVAMLGLLQNCGSWSRVYKSWAPDHCGS